MNPHMKVRLPIYSNTKFVESIPTKFATHMHTQIYSFSKSQKVTFTALHRCLIIRRSVSMMPFSCPAQSGVTTSELPDHTDDLKWCWQPQPSLISMSNFLTILKSISSGENPVFSCSYLRLTIQLLRITAHPTLRVGFSALFVVCLKWPELC